MYCVIARGAFLGVEEKVFGFERIIVIRELEDDFEITNEHLLICLAKL